MIRGWTISGLPEAGESGVVKLGEEKALRETLSSILVPKHGLEERGRVTPLQGLIVI